MRKNTLKAVFEADASDSLIPSGAWRVFDKYLGSMKGTNECDSNAESEYLQALLDFIACDTDTPPKLDQQAALDEVGRLASDLHKALVSLPHPACTDLADALCTISKRAVATYEVARHIREDVTLAVAKAKLRLSDRRMPRGRKPELARDHLVRDLKRIFADHKASNRRKENNRPGRSENFVNEVLDSLGRRMLESPTEAVRRGKTRGIGGRQKG